MPRLAFPDLAPLETLVENARGALLPLPPRLARLYGRLRMPAARARPHVFTNFAATVDGVVSLNIEGHKSGGDISGWSAQDRMVMGLLRSVADAVVVGSGTFVVDRRHLWTAEDIFPKLAADYARLRAALGKRGPPLNAVVSGSGNLDLRLPMFSSGKVPALVVTTPAGERRLRRQKVPDTVAIRAVRGDGKTIGARTVLDAVLRESSGKSILVEGGPRLIADFYAEGLLDEQFLTLSPQIAGRAIPDERISLVMGRTFAPKRPLWGTLADARRARTGHLFLRYAFPPVRVKIDPDDFRVRAGDKVRLKKWPTRVKPYYASDLEYRRRLADHVERMSALQALLYASNRHALLLVFQAMDAAGKDGVIKHVMSGINPQGCQVFSFKHPSAEELQHDFLWRTTRFLPERGRIGIFNRSYYEEVLIVRVHPEILRGQNLPPDLTGDDSLWKGRFRSIAGLEEHLSRNGTRILKFFLHLSKEEQRRRFIARIDEPHKNWKFNLADIEERKHWKAYMSAYEDCLEATSTRHAPWYVVPADDKQNARLIVSRIVVRALEGLDMSYPETGAARLRELKALRARLAR